MECDACGKKYKCECFYEEPSHGIECIKSPSGKEWAIGGICTKDRFLYCPWCGGYLPGNRKHDN